jgi:hypothetical protein
MLPLYDFMMWRFHASTVDEGINNYPVVMDRKSASTKLCFQRLRCFLHAGAKVRSGDSLYCYLATQKEFAKRLYTSFHEKKRINPGFVIFGRPSSSDG